MLAPASSPSAVVKVPARHLMRGDITGSGEVVISVSVGARTPRGMVDIILQKGDRKRAAIWNARTIIGVRRGSEQPKAAIDAEIPPSDRLPTFQELATFDAGAAWDKLTAAQQREIGALALRFGSIGQCGGLFHETLAEVRSSFASSHWTPEVQITAVWPQLHIQLLESAAVASFQALCDHFDPLWPQMFGWLARKEVN